MSNNKNVVLAIFAHSDDELGCAGTLKNHSDNGDKVYLAFLSKGENATTIKGNTDEKIQQRRAHTKKIEDLLGVEVKYLDLPDSKIEYNTENGYKVAELIKETKPNIIISWTKYNNRGGGHPDHRNCADLVRDAISYARYINNESNQEPYRENLSFYTYYSGDNGSSSKIVFTDVTKQEDVIRKFIDIYKEAYGDWPVDDFKFSNMTYFGRMSGVKYAEVFEQVMRGKPASKLLV